MTHIYKKEAYGFFDRHYSRVRIFIRSIVREDWIAEDLTQEVFIRAFNHLPSLKDQSRAKPWLFRIAKNLCVDYFRQEGYDKKRITPLVDPSELACSHPMGRALEQQEMTECVQNHFQLLPEKLRTVLWLFDVEGFKHKEIADILDIEVNNVKVRLHRARKKMRNILHKNCEFERDDRNVFVCVPSGDNSKIDPSLGSS